MQARGYKIERLNPANLAQSSRFNPLHRARSRQSLRQIAETICLNTIGEQKGKGDFWVITAINMLYICLCALTNYPDQSYIHFGNIRKLVNNFAIQDKGKPIIEEFMCNYLESESLEEYKRLICYDERVLTSIIASASAALDMWSDPDILKLTATDNIGIENLRARKTIIYINIPEDKINYFSLIVNLFYSSCFQYCIQNTTGEPVFFFLDEFGNLGKINSFENIITTLRKRNCSINIILQELSQLKAIYGHYAASSIFSGGIGNKLFFAGLDVETCQYLSRALGNTTVYDSPFVNLYPFNMGYSERRQSVAKPLQSPDEIRMMKSNQAIIISDNKPPIKIKMPWFSDVPNLNKLTKKNPAQLNFDYTNEKISHLNL